MVDELEHKYEVKVQAREGRQKLPERWRNDGRKRKIEIKRSQSKDAKKNEAGIC